MPPSRSERCPQCGAPLVMVHVHGHGQCSRCGCNVEPCCTGASALDEADEPEAGQGVDPQLFPRLFDELGGRSRSVTRTALLFALQRWLDAPLADAAEVLAAGVRLGHVEQHGDVLRLGPASPSA